MADGRVPFPCLSPFYKAGVLLRRWHHRRGLRSPGQCVLLGHSLGPQPGSSGPHASVIYCVPSPMMERSPPPWDGAGPWEVPWRRGAPTTPTPSGAPVPHPCLSGAPARPDPALAVCRLRVGAWSLGHPSTPLGDSCLDGEVQESGEALFRRAPVGLSGRLLGASSWSSRWGEGRLTPDPGGCRGVHGPRSPHVHTPGGAEDFRVGAAGLELHSVHGREPGRARRLDVSAGWGRPVSRGLPILFFQKHPRLLLFASELSQRPQPSAPSCFL